MSSLGVIFAALIAVLVAISSTVLANDCVTGQACQPWRASSVCDINGRMDVRFLIENWPSPAALNYSNTYGIYSFCPLVDQTQGYRLQDAGQFAVNSFATAQSSTLNQTFISVYGQGSVEDGLLVPSGGDATAMFAYAFTIGNDPFGSGCNGGETGVVSFLLLNYTMTNGNYLYSVNNSQPIGYPINNGFSPTCQDGKCLFGDAGCIGPAGNQNCARCYSTSDLIQNHTVKVWATYYGTDEHGRTFTSNQDNPLNFLQYATQSAYTELSSSL